jgi:hypothetical protein
VADGEVGGAAAGVGDGNASHAHEVRPVTTGSAQSLNQRPLSGEKLTLH